MKISVVMAACNAGPLLHETVESAKLAAGNCDHEIIVVNDQSVDGEPDKLCKSVKRIDTTVRSGCSGSRHIGVKAATGDAVIIADPHCTFTKNCFGKLCDMATRTQPSIVIPFLQCQNISMRRGIKLYFGSLKLHSRGMMAVRFRKPMRWAALGGAIYVLSRHTVEFLRYMPPLPFLWGGYEMYWTLVAHRLGVNIINCPVYPCCIHRKYRDSHKLPYNIETNGRDLNEQWALKTVVPMFWPILFKRICDKHNERLGTKVLPYDEEEQAETSHWLRQNEVISESQCLEVACRLKGLFKNELTKELIR